MCRGATLFCILIVTQKRTTLSLSFNNKICAADHFGALVVPFLKTDLYHVSSRSDPYFFVHFGSEQRANLQMFLGSKIYYSVHFLLTTTCQLLDFLSPKDLLCINDCFMSLCKVTWKNASTRAITTILHQLKYLNWKRKRIIPELIIRLVVQSKELAFSENLDAQVRLLEIELKYKDI
ncbi:hypothetical protein ACJX0J_012046 [Zea mays]